MTLADFPELARLTKAQKRKLAEELWLAATEDRIPVSRDARQTLDGRWADYRNGQLKRISPQELRRRLAQM